MNNKIKYNKHVAHGNTTKMPHLQEMKYDYADQLNEVTLDASNNKAYYIYNAEGERVRKVIEKGNIKEERFYIGDYELYTKKTNETLDTERETLHIQDDKSKVALIDYDGTTTTIRYQYTNHLDSASLELDETGAIITYEEYHPFGTTSYRSGRNEIDVSLKRYKYVHKELDNETGLYYYGMRYYAPWIARFISVDPLQFKYPIYTPYQYAGNAPISNTDLDGAEPENKVDYDKQLNVELDNLQSEFNASLRPKPFEKFEKHSWEPIGWQGLKFAGNVGISILNSVINTLNYGDMILKGEKDVYDIDADFSKSMETLFYKTDLNSSDFIEDAFGGAIVGFGVSKFFPKTPVKSRSSVSSFETSVTTVLDFEIPTFKEMPKLSIKNLDIKSLDVDIAKIEKGKVIGLGLDADLDFFRGTDAITYKYGGWQKTKLTKVDWGRASMDNYFFEKSFQDAAFNANAIRFNVTTFDPFWKKPGITNMEFNFITTKSSLLKKTTFIKGGKNVKWDGNFFH